MKWDHTSWGVSIGKSAENSSGETAQEMMSELVELAIGSEEVWPCKVSGDEIQRSER